MKKINIIIFSILIIFFSVSISHISYGANETTDSIKNDRGNNYLESLLVEGYDLYPEFNKNILTYYVVLSPDVNTT